MDKIDAKILEIVQKDGSITNKDLASKINLSPAATLSRVNKLKKSGIIKLFTAVLDEKKLDYDISTITFVNLAPHNRKTSDNFIKNIQKIPQIQECHNITGNWDYMLRIVAKDMQSYKDFVIDQLLEIAGVNKIETIMILNTEKETKELPL